MTPRFTIELDGQRWEVDPRGAVDLSIPLDFSAPAVRAFGLPHATSAPFRVDGFVGAVAHGGPVNCFNATLWPHGNGTHTETVGHILDPPPPIGEALLEPLIPAVLLECELERLGDSGEHYPEPRSREDRVITAAALERAASGVDATPALWRALVIRSNVWRGVTGPIDFSGDDPGYLTHDAMRWIRARGVEHLIVELPSVDREEDAGALTNHRIFWDVPAGACSCDDGMDLGRTITEMARVPEHLPVGPCFLSLQAPHFILDAAPSRPLWFAARPTDASP